MKPKSNCQNRHIHKNNRTLDKKKCKYCNAFVTLDSDGNCTCCGEKYYFKNNKSKRPMQNVLNHFVSEYHNAIEWWLGDPQDKPIILELPHGYWVYQIELRWLAKYYCLADIDRKPLPTPTVIESETIKFGKSKVPKVVFDHDCRVGKMQKESNKFTEYDKTLATLDMIRPHLRKVDLHITWGKKHVTKEIVCA